MEIEISADFPFKPNYLSVNGSTIHYIDEGDRTDCETVFLFLHGNPTSCYLWRNIIPHLTPYGRCIAPDLIGFGKSGKPDIDYTFGDHYHYIRNFILKLNLKNIVLILHDWGGAIGFHFARLHPEKIRGIAFMETFYKPMEWQNLDPFARWIFRKFRDPQMSEFLNGRLNLFVKFILPLSMNRKLTKKEKLIYSKPFTSPESRKPVVMFPRELPFSGSGSNNERIVAEYFKWFCSTDIPKLILYAKPGIQIKEKQVNELKNSLRNLSASYVGRGKHFIQEDQPAMIGKEIKKWYKSINLI